MGPHYQIRISFLALNAKPAASGQLASVVAATLAARIFSWLLRSLLFFGEKAALFTATNTSMSPEAFENEFGGSCGVGLIFAIGDAKFTDVLENILDFGDLLVPLRSANDVGNFQFAAKFKPLDDRLKIDISKVLAEDSADGGANQFTGDGLRTF